MDASSLEKILHEVTKIQKPQGEINLFSIGARGYYENPTSDMLSFFLDPAGGHGLGDLVLSSFLNKLKRLDIFPELASSPEREYVTDAKNRIDIVLEGSDWVMAIENKIWAGCQNDFNEYRHSIEKAPRFKEKDVRLFVVLSFDKPSAPQGWQWVNYKDLISEVRKRLGDLMVTTGFSKWTLFLRELLINLESQRGPVMEDEEFNLVLKYYKQIVETKQLHDRYIAEVINRLKQRVKSVCDLEVNPKRHSWGDYGIALRVFPWDKRKDNVTLLLMTDGIFRIQVYISKDKLRDGVTEKSFMFYNEIESDTSGGLWHFRTDTPDISDLSEAIQVFGEAVRLVFDNTVN